MPLTAKAAGQSRPNAMNAGKARQDGHENVQSGDGRSGVYWRDNAEVP